MRRLRIARLLAVLALTITMVCQTMVGNVPAADAATNKPVYRALIIGNNAYEKSALKGCINDAKAVKGALAASTAIKYSKLTLKTDLTANNLARAISAIADWKVKSTDVTVIYYSGHGYRDAGGATGLVGIDLKKYSFSQMERALALIPGKIVILIDSCYSGGLIGKSASSAAAKSSDKNNSVKNYNQAIVDVFACDQLATPKALNGNKYHVITAASGSEQSFESGGYGYFTTGVTEALGWNINTGKVTKSLYGDADGNGTVSVSEAYSHASDVVGGFRGDQHVQISPSGSSLGLVSRGTVKPSSANEALTSEPDGAPAATKLPNPKVAVLSSGQMMRLNTSHSLTWKSSNPSAATVSTNGLVVGRSKGKTTITGTKSGKTWVKCKVGVTSAGKSVKAVTLSKTSISRTVGQTYRLKAKISPSGAARKALRWYSSDKSIVVVSGKGAIKAKKPGTAKVYAITSSGVSASCTVVVEAGAVTKVQQKKSKLKLAAGKKLKLQARALPTTAAQRGLIWTSSDTKIAKVNSSTGVVTALKSGKVYIIATATDGSGKSSKCLISVTKKK